MFNIVVKNNGGLKGGEVVWFISFFLAILIIDVKFLILNNIN